MSAAADAEALNGLLAPLRDDPGAAAILCDIDGTLAPIVADPAAAAVPAPTRAALSRLAERFGLVGCVSGRPASTARELMGIDELAYAGNHGLELLMPGERELRIDARVAATAAGDFVARLDHADLRSHGFRIEDKGPIQAIHWRGAPDRELAETRAAELAELIASEGLVPHFGRMVLEVRPVASVDKGTAVRRLVEGAASSAALYGGDDRTDLDAFAALRALASSGAVGTAVCIGVASGEGPPEIVERADAVVDGPDGFATVLTRLAA